MSAAVFAGSAVIQIPFGEDVPIAADHLFAATRTGCAASGFVVDVAGVDVLQAGGLRDVAGSGQGCRGRRRVVEHAKVGVEGGEVQGDVGAEFFSDPGGHFFEFRV